MTPDVGYSAGGHSDDPAPDVTVLMPTYRRPIALRFALAGLAAQRLEGPRWEVIVVDNDVAPGSEGVVAEAARSFAVPIRYLREPRLGVCHARNLAISEARGEAVVMIDDDVVPDTGWLTALLEPLLSGRCDAVGGRVVLDPGVPRPRWLDEEGIGGYLTHFDPTPEERPLRDGEAFVTANAAVRTDLLRAIGGFATHLGPQGRRHLVADDDDLSRRLRSAGCRLRYVPKAVVIHELPRERLRRRYLLRRAWLHGRSEWLLDRAILEQGQLNGARPAITRLITEARRRRSEDLRDPAVRFHLLCNVVRAAASISEGASWWYEGSTLARGRLHGVGAHD